MIEIPRIEHEAARLQTLAPWAAAPAAPLLQAVNTIAVTMPDTIPTQARIQCQEEGSQQQRRRDEPPCFRS
jgi:hypothetical protein